MFDYATHLRPRTRLVRRTIPIAIATVLVALAGLSLSGSVAASNSDEGVQGCTLATLKGRYLVADAGTLLPPAVPQPTLTAWAGRHGARYRDWPLRRPDHAGKRRRPY